jgi:prolyl-tRNA synthetase
MVNVLAIPVITGRKTDNERFAGATTTWACEAMMRDGKALQMGTSHELGQNFARAFDITYLDESGTQSYVWQTSWGVSTRLMGALVMVHGDDDGLRLPPRLAPVQVVVVLARADDGAGDAAAALAAELSDAGLRVELDARTDTSFGRRVVDWELKGVPLRVEVGPRDLAEGTVVLARRDTGTKTSVALPHVAAAVTGALDAIHAALFDEALELRRTHTVDVATLEEAEQAASTGFAVVPMAVLAGDGETRLNRAGISVRCIQSADGGLPGADDDAATIAAQQAVVGRAY